MRSRVSEGECKAGSAGAQRGRAVRDLEVWIDQELCTGDGLCVQYAPEVFEFDVDGLAYVKDADRRPEAGGRRPGARCRPACGWT